MMDLRWTISTMWCDGIWQSQVLNAAKGQGKAGRNIAGQNASDIFSGAIGIQYCMEICTCEESSKGIPSRPSARLPYVWGDWYWKRAYVCPRYCISFYNGTSRYSILWFLAHFQTQLFKIWYLRIWITPVAFRHLTDPSNIRICFVAIRSK